MPPQFSSPAFWMSTAPRPPARLAPQATATASSSRATSTARMRGERRTSAMSRPIQVSGTEAASVTPADSSPATMRAAPVTPYSRAAEHHERVGGQVQAHRLPDRQRHGRGLGDEDEHALAVGRAAPSPPSGRPGRRAPRSRASTTLSPGPAARRTRSGRIASSSVLARRQRAAGGHAGASPRRRAPRDPRPTARPRSTVEAPMKSATKRVAGRS